MIIILIELSEIDVLIFVVLWDTEAVWKLQWPSPLTSIIWSLYLCIKTCVSCVSFFTKVGDNSFIVRYLNH